MGLNNTLKSLVKKAMVATGDLKSSITYVVRVPGNYSVATDTTLDTLTTYNNVPALLTRLTEDDMDWFPVNATGQKILIAYEDLPIVPNAADYVVINSITWNVHKVRAVPGNSLHIIYVKMA